MCVCSSVYFAYLCVCFMCLQFVYVDICVYSASTASVCVCVYCVCTVCTPCRLLLICGLFIPVDSKGVHAERIHQSSDGG